MKLSLGPLKVHINRERIAYIWKDNDVRSIPLPQFGRANDQEPSDDPSSYYQDGYDQDDSYHQAANYYPGYDAEQSGEYEDRPGEAVGQLDFLFRNDLIMYAALVLVPPLGIWILMQHRQKPDLSIRAAISAASLIWFIVLLVLIFSPLFGNNADPTTAQLATQPPIAQTQTNTTDQTDGGSDDITSAPPVNSGQTPVDPVGSDPITTTGGSNGGGTGSTPTNATASDPIVYATASGPYYHKTADCTNIPADAKATPLLQSEAVAGNRSACNVCFGSSAGSSTPGTGSTSANESKMVWATRNGKHYHSVKDCSTVSNPSNITLARALEDGKTPCQTCTISYYYTKNGKYVHKKANCSGMTNAIKISYANAKATNKPSCPVCIRKVAKTIAAFEASKKKTTTTKTTGVSYYATTTGKYYHTKANCSGMTNAKKVTLAKAKAAGKTACPVCVAKTTTTGSATYYSALGGKYYHIKSNCSGMKGATKVTLATAKKRGQKPCPTCIPQANSAKANDTKAVYYATKNGTYYHTKANCSGMTGAKKITLQTALNNGKKACPTCFKKATGTTTSTSTTGTTNTYVYATTLGKYYHSNSTCSGMKGAKRVTLANAVKSGKKACPTCMKRTYYYASSTNRYYHKTANCSGMKNATRVTLASAKAKGRLACPVCILKKATTADLKVGTYVAKGGKYYHKNKTCNGLKNAKKVSLAYAKGSGRTACPRCVLNQQATTANADKKVACYVIKKGTYYHSTKSCNKLVGRTGISKTSVYKAKQNEYRACPDCVSAKQRTYVYATPTGLYYHSKASCAGSKNVMKLSLQTALNRAYRRCTKCDAPAA